MGLDPQAIWYGIDGERHGPVDLETLRRLIASRSLRPEDYLWDEGLGDWVQLRRYPSLLRPPADDPPSLQELHPLPAPPPGKGDDSKEVSPSALRQATDYAGFGVRLLAWIIDVCVLLIPAWIWIQIVEGQTGVEFERFFEEFASGRPLTGDALEFELRLQAGMLVLRWLYEATLESSVWQATVGKRVMGLAVTDEGGARLSFLRATARHFSKILSQIPFMAGYFLVLLTARRQALHDKVARTLVIRRRI